MNPFEIGVNRSNTLLQRRGEIGGARYVFVKLKGIKNQLVYPTFGGRIMNPFLQTPAKAFAGDLLEFRMTDKGDNPEVYILKTYEVAKQVSNSTTVLIKRDGYRHRPCVGDKIGVAPANIGGAISTVLTVLSVVETVDESQSKVWKLTVDKSSTISPKTILVEADSSNNMLVKQINAFFDADFDFCYEPATGDEDFDNARYMYTPAIGGAIMYKKRMSPIPACVEKLNVSRYNGWFMLPSIG